MKGKNAMFDKQTKKFCSAVVDALPDLPEDEMQGWIGSPRRLQRLLRSAFSVLERGFDNFELYLHTDQKGHGRINGHRLHKHLVETGIIRTCLDLRDAKEIQKKGVVSFQKRFGNQLIFCWQAFEPESARDDRTLRVLCVCVVSNEVCLQWHGLDCDWGSDSPAARFAS